MAAELVCSDPPTYAIRIPVPWTPGRWTNVFVVKGEGEDLLIDTGSYCKQAEEIIDEAFLQLAVRPDRLSVFLTHVHVDHAGLAARLARMGARIVLGAGEHAWMMRQRGLVRGCSMEDEIARMGRYGLDRDVVETMAESSTKLGIMLPDDVPVRLVREGDTVPCAPYLFDVIETPGHSPGHTVLLERGRRILFVGDHVLSDEKPMMCALFAPQNTCALYVWSLEKMREFDGVAFLQSHGSPVMEQPLRRVDELVQHHRLRLEQAFQAVDQNPSATGLECIRGMRRIVDGKPWDELRFGKRYCIEENGVTLLEQLRYDGRVIRTAGQDGRYRFHVA